MSIRKWLRENSFQYIDDTIVEVEAEFKANGSKERRNWADVLSGGKDGSPVTVAGREFPVLAAAQEIRGKPVTPNAIRGEEHEPFPAARVTGRWPKRRKLSRVKTKRITATKVSRAKHARAS